MNFVFSFPIAVLSQYFFATIIFVLSLFMVLLILVQRGKGGGLTGALGGPGGQSAFGTKAGDLFTRITIVAAACWIFLLAFCVWWYTESDFSAALANSEVSGTGPAIGAPADGGMSGAMSSDPTMAVPTMAVPTVAVPTTGTTEATSPVIPSGQAPSDASDKPAAEVEVGDMPKTAESTGKDIEKSSAEPPKTTESTPASSTPPELAPPEPAPSEPKLDSGTTPPTPEK